MVKATPPFDVFISNSHRDAAVSEDLARVLRSYGLSVFTETDMAPGRNIDEDAMWDAMSESQALVAVIPETDPSARVVFELGAAKAWNKPIYAVASNPAKARLPVALRGTILYPTSRIEEIAQEIKNSAATLSLSEAEVAVLVDEFGNIGASVDQLSQEPQRLSTLTKHFEKRAKRTTTPEEVLRTLLRLRKRGKLASPVGKRPKAV